jgi:transcriptional regulator CtsR
METATLTSKEIQNYIYATFLYKTNKEIASTLQVKGSTIGANYSHLKMGGRITATDEIEREILVKVNAIFQKENKSFLKHLVNNFSNESGVQKSQARVIIMRAILSGVINGTVLSLPFHTCTLEGLINSQNDKLNFLGCEIDSQTFKAMQNTIEHTNLPIEAYEGTIGDKIYSAKVNEFAHLILDYCGTINTFHKEIEYAMENDIMQVNGAMCVTISKMGMQNNMGKMGEILSKFPKGMFGDMETEMVNKLFFQNLCEKYPNYKIETCFQYQDVKKDSKGQPIMRANNTPSKKMPMMLFVIRRIK